MNRRLSRLLPLVALAFLLAGAGPGAASSSNAAAGSASGASCCKVVYNAAKTHVQVSGVVAFRGEPILFSFHGPCASPAGPGRANVKSRWIPLKELVAGYHTIAIVQKVNGRIVTTKSPRFFIKGKAQLRKPTVAITGGPKGVSTGTSALFKVKGTSYGKLECRLDRQPWQSCSTGWAQYQNLQPGPHTFTVRAYSLDGKSFVEQKRVFVLSAPPPVSP